MKSYHSTKYLLGQIEDQTNYESADSYNSAENRFSFVDGGEEMVDVEDEMEFP